MGSFVLGCMALGYMVLPLLPNRQLQLEGDGLRLLAQRHEDPRAVQAESGMDTVEVDLALAQDADRAEINAEADFMFREVDVNGDGKISQQELHEYLGSAGYSVEQTTRIFEALDVNSDESITQEELRVGFARYEFSALRLAFGLAGARPQPEGESAAADPRAEPGLSDAESASRLANANELFDLIDNDCSGEVDKREFTAHLSKAGYSMVTIAQIFEILDVNIDGVISREEMRRGFLSYEYSALRLALGIKPGGHKI